MPANIKPHHYLSALALNAKFLTFEICGEHEFIYAWCANHWRNRQMVDWVGYMLPESARSCCYRFIEDSARFDQEKSEPSIEYGAEDFESQRWTSQVRLPGDDSVHAALFYLEQILPNVKWHSSQSDPDRSDSDWEVTNGLYLRLRFTGGRFYPRVGKGCESGFSNLYQALRWIYRELIQYQFEEMSLQSLQSLDFSISDRELYEMAEIEDKANCPISAGLPFSTEMLRGE